jgi:hypothetical protein
VSGRQTSADSRVPSRIDTPTSRSSTTDMSMAAGDDSHPSDAPAEVACDQSEADGF